MHNGCLAFYHLKHSLLYATCIENVFFLKFIPLWLSSFPSIILQKCIIPDKGNNSSLSFRSHCKTHAVLREGLQFQHRSAEKATSKLLTSLRSQSPSHIYQRARGQNTFEYFFLLRAHAYLPSLTGRKKTVLYESIVVAGTIAKSPFEYYLWKP